MQHKIIIDENNLTVYDYKKAGLFSDELVEDNKSVIPTHVIELVQKAYNIDGTVSIAIFFETEDQEYFYTQNDLLNNLDELFNSFIEVRDNLKQTHKLKYIYRIEEYNVETKETIDK